MVGCGWDDAGGCSDVGGSWVGEAEGVGVGVGSCVGAGADASAICQLDAFRCCRLAKPSKARPEGVLGATGCSWPLMIGVPCIGHFPVASLLPVVPGMLIMPVTPIQKLANPARSSKRQAHPIQILFTRQNVPLIFASRLPVSCSDIPVVYVPCSRVR